MTALQSCVRTLSPGLAEVDPLPPVRAGDCGAAAPVALAAIGAQPRVAVHPPAMLNCAMVARLYRWLEETVQPAARDLFGAPVVKISNVSGYQCRNRDSLTGAAGSKMSEHAFANAIDIGAFELANGRLIDVSTGWGATARDLKTAREQDASASGANGQGGAASVTQADPRPKATPKDGAKRARAGGPGRAEAEEPDRRQAARQESSDGAKRTGSAASGSAGGERGEASRVSATPEMPLDARFLRRLHAGACGPFGTVLGPEANEAHRDHLHLDLAPRKRTAFCE